MGHLSRLVDNLRQDFKGFLYWCVVFTLFRLAFIFVFREQLGSLAPEALGQALFLGLRLSLKTCGFIMLGSALFASLPMALWPAWPARKVRLAWHSLALLLFSVAFMVRIPYYSIFHSAFDMMVINGLYDDQGAILDTAIREYQAPWRLAGALLIAAALVYAFWRLIGRREAVQHCYSRLRLGLALAFVPVFWVFCRYGGAFDYAHSISWINCGRLPSNLLNEAVLDDGQALYRVYYIKEDMDRAARINLSPAQLRAHVAQAGGRPAGSSLDGCFIRVVAQPKLARQPQDVVLIVGETFGVWPFLDRFKPLGLVEEMSALAASDRGAQVGTMLADGLGTIYSINELLTGLPFAGIYANHQLVSYKGLYAAGIATIMRDLGYKPVFWYGGFPEWQNLEKFALAQGFAEFHCANEMNQAGGNSWGCPDKELFRNITAYMAKEREKTFHLVLTISNHPPYTVDVDGEGFPRAQVRERLRAMDTRDMADDEQTLTSLGHIWYADHTMGRFVKTAEALRPDSLFIITGDHSDRFDFVKEQDIRTRSLLPCIFYGRGVDPSWSSLFALGCHLQLPGTFAELLGPPGFRYCAYYPDLFAQPSFVFSRLFYANRGELRQLGRETEAEKRQLNALRQLAAWRVMKGDRME